MMKACGRRRQQLQLQHVQTDDVDDMGDEVCARCAASIISTD